MSERSELPRAEPPLRAPPASERPEPMVLRGERRIDGGPARRRPRGSIPVALVLILAGIVSAIVGLWEMSERDGLNPALAPAIDAAEEIAVVTGSVYISLRAINAALSAAQEVEIGASIGAQASLQPLKVLEPVDDTVERVADVVFTVAAGTALATVGFEPVTAIGLVLLGVGLVGFGGSRLLGHGSGAAASLRAVRLGAALGLVLPLVFAGGVWLGDRATAPQWDAAMAELAEVTGEAMVLIGAGEEGLLEEAGVEAGGLFSGFFAAVTDATASVQSYAAAAQVFTDEADALFNATLTIIGIFILRTLVLPALLLWSVMALLRKSVA